MVYTCYLYLTTMTSCVDTNIDNQIDTKPVIDIKPEIRNLETPAMTPQPHHPIEIHHAELEAIKSPGSHFYLPDMYGLRDPLGGVHPPYQPTPLSNHMVGACFRYTPRGPATYRIIILFVGSIICGLNYLWTQL